MAPKSFVSREETPVDVNARSGPRIVYPPLNQNGSPPSVASVAPSAPLSSVAANGTMPNNEPRKISTLSVKGDPAAAGLPATRATSAGKTGNSARRHGSRSSGAPRQSSLSQCQRQRALGVNAGRATARTGPDPGRLH